MFYMIKPYWGLLLQQQKSHTDLSAAWFDCTKEMMKICRQGRSNGEDILEVWRNCQAPSTGMIDAFSKFLGGQSKALQQFYGSSTPTG